MDNQLFLLCQLFLVVLVGGVLWAIRKALKHSYTKMGMPEGRRAALLQFALGIFIFWLVLLAQLALLGFFSQSDNMPLRLLLAFAPPLLLFLGLLFNRFFRLLLRLVPLSWLVYAQAVRLPLEIIRWLGYEGDFVPLQVTFAGLNYDVIVGLSAIVAGTAFFRRGRLRKIEAIVWNVFGFFMLLQVQVLTVYSMPSPFRLFSTEPSYWLESAAPFVWIPGLLVPFCLALHLYSIVLLWQAPSPTARFLLRRRDMP